MIQVLLIDRFFDVQKRGFHEIIVLPLEIRVFRVLDDTKVIIIKKLAKVLKVFTHWLGCSVQAVATMRPVP